VRRPRGRCEGLEAAGVQRERNKGEGRKAMQKAGQAASK
jgi:hypothetical protein